MSETPECLCELENAIRVSRDKVVCSKWVVSGWTTPLKCCLANGRLTWQHIRINSDNSYSYTLKLRVRSPTGYFVFSNMYIFPWARYCKSAAWCHYEFCSQLCAVQRKFKCRNLTSSLVFQPPRLDVSQRPQPLTSSLPNGHHHLPSPRNQSSKLLIPLEAITSQVASNWILFQCSVVQVGVNGLSWAHQQTAPGQKPAALSS